MTHQPADPVHPPGPGEPVQEVEKGPHPTKRADEKPDNK